MPAFNRVLAVGNVYPPHDLGGGYELIWRGAMVHLREQGAAVRILATTYRRPDAVDEEPEWDVHRQLDWYWHEHRWRRLGPVARLRLERRNAEIFDRHLAEFSPDVITWWSIGGMSLSLIERARRAGIPSVLFVLDYWPVYGLQRDLWLRQWATLSPIRELGERLTKHPTRVDLDRAGRWVFCSQAARDEILATGLRPARSEIASPGIDEAYLSVDLPPAPSPWRWRLLYVGRVVEQKGVSSAIESLVLLPSQATLRIIGEGDPPYRAELERLALRVGVSGRVEFVPTLRREELIEAYRDADAVVFPVKWTEPWGQVPLEAMAVGVPVVATGRGGSGDYLEQERNCLLFAAGDAAGLAAALERLAADETLRCRLRDGGLKTAAAHTEARFNRRVQEAVEAEIAGASPRAQSNIER